MEEYEKWYQKLLRALYDDQNNEPVHAEGQKCVNIPIDFLDKE